MTADLVQFLRDRLDEDEQAAQAATPGPWTTMGRRVLDSSPPSNRMGIGMAVGHATASADYNETAAHIARHDPARVLAEVDAKREVLRLAVGLHDYAPTFTTGVSAAMEHALRLFALAYAEHPEYREEWRP